MIRGGRATRETLRSALLKSMRDDQVLELSMFSFGEMDAEGIARRVRANDPNFERSDLPHPKMQASTCGQIRDILSGVDGGRFLLTEPPPGHHSVRFDDEPADEVLDALVDAFGGEHVWIANPGRRS